MSCVSFMLMAIFMRFITAVTRGDHMRSVHSCGGDIRALPQYAYLIFNLIL
jgi:hypothetical protein